jgi:ionotropic glutamate receptor
MLQDADIAVGPISVTAEREQVVDFTTPYYDFAGLQILMKALPNEESMFVFATVFTPLVWASWISVLVGTAILAFIFEKLISKCVPADRDSNESKEEEDKPFTLHESVWFVVASFTKAGVYIINRNGANWT